MTGRKVISVMRLPQIDPPFAEDQCWRDGCMMPPITWPQRVIRQLFPRRGVGTAAITIASTGMPSPKPFSR